MLNSQERPTLLLGRPRAPLSRGPRRWFPLHLKSEGADYSQARLQKGRSAPTPAPPGSPLPPPPTPLGGSLWAPASPAQRVRLGTPLLPLPQPPHPPFFALAKIPGNDFCFEKANFSVAVFKARPSGLPGPIPTGAPHPRPRSAKPVPFSTGAGRGGEGRGAACGNRTGLLFLGGGV